MSDAPKFKDFTAVPPAGSYRALRSVPVQKEPKTETVPESQGMDKYGQDKMSQDKSGMDKSRQDKTGQAKKSNRVEISPTKNFTKTSNSIVKTAIPEKYFRGQSKHTYDVLYLRTRGAINPVRQIQLSKTELVKLTGLAEKTVQLHIRYLRDAGLINVHPQMGSHNGWIYEIFVPEELEDLTEYGQDKISMDKSGMVKSGMDKTSQNLSSQTMQNLSILDHTNHLENKELSKIPNTLLNTNTNDDEAFALFIQKFQSISQKLTGRKLSKRDAEKLNDFADLLILELEVAASRAASISSVPAFLTEVLRRQFFAARQQQTTSSANQTKTKIDTVGKIESGVYEIKPLDEKGREAALEQLREFAGDDFLQDFKKWYTPDDWTWLIKQLEK
jgi:hypothetical protein